ncbi:MAG: radical SAM protein [Methanobacteriota archaeon]
MEESIAFLKARILSLGEVFVEPGCELPRTFSRSTAGPGAGGRSLAFSFRGTKVKLSITSDERSPLHLTREGSFVAGGQEFPGRVRVVPILLHCPEQAFVNVEAGCSKGCAFCATPLTPQAVASKLTENRVVGMVLAAAKEPSFKAVAVTGGVTEDPQNSLDRMLDVVKRVREALPTVPIGVEPYVESPDGVDELREAGADEMKINIEAATGAISAKACPGRNRDAALAGLERAVKTFGRGMVTSNLIFGLGESEAELEECVGMLAAMGVVPNLRALRVDAGNRWRLREALGFSPSTPSAKRMMEVARMHKAVLERNGLTTLTFKTMCFPCGCCDIVPFRDV